MTTILNKLSALLGVKSLVTLSLTGVFCAMAIMGRISEELFMSVFTVVIAFYFGIQTAKKGGDGDGR